MPKFLLGALYEIPKDTPPHVPPLVQPPPLLQRPPYLNTPVVDYQ
jgi:hypothetical protein